ncbi:mitogen-activated protein kinase kinase kinase 3-like isoform X2 [Pomacea canaliculata]|uniref:mitogen-activated protein kinase kinase kinase 3-like isoform X2 n=1 Tax=Pomacea canaliculata TaxID=400727 RepID=UPI000D725F2C|nr:mitogen-activated protein kinase kinase kinase 3-like isoform X2 [Pomacea canaliculata]
MDREQDGSREVMESIETILARGLKMGDRQVRRAAYHNLQRRNELKVKCEFNGEKRVTSIPRPVTFEQLSAKLKEMYQIPLNIFYTQSNGEIYIGLKCQGDLNSAIQLVDQNEHTSSLRLYLTSAMDTPLPTQPTHPAHPSATSSSQYPYEGHRQSPSPPPGSLPAKDYIRTTSYVEGEGTFIPEPAGHDMDIFSYRDVTMSDSVSSLDQQSVDSSYISASGHNDTYPFRRRDSRRSVLSDSAKDEYGRESKKHFGTFPRGFESANHPPAADGTGNLTFPRSAGRRPDNEYMSVRTLMSRGSEGTLSTCSSGSSGLPPDPDMDSPGGAYPSRSSALFTKSPRAPTHWKKGRILGTGAFGMVYQCYDQDTGMELAVKQVQLGAMNAEVSKEVRALENEVQLLRNFQHERIVQYYGCQQDASVLSIFIEFMPGGSVQDHLKQHGPLNEVLARKYSRQVLEGLAFLHKNVIVHRDIKAANVLRDTMGNVKLGDFGASKRLQVIASATGLKTAVGTPHWMAPEVINGEGYGRKADVWSVGCTLVEMLTSKPPFADYEPLAAMFQIATSKHPKYELPATCSTSVRDFLMLTFQRTPTDRPSAEDLLKDKFVRDST